MSTQGHLAYAPLDSDRFGIRVMRGTLEANYSAEAIISEINSADADLVILRVPAGEPSIAIELQCLGQVVIHADTLVYYSIDLTSVLNSQAQAQAQAQAQVRIASTMDREAISTIAEKCFASYRAHYAANPLLPKDLVLSGYVEWALSRLNSDHSGSQTWVVCAGETIAGFATCDVMTETVEIVLNAVHPDFERRGLYAALLRHMLHHYSRKSFKELVISTQIWNYVVQRQWARAGLRILKAYDTYHIDRRLIANGHHH